MKLIKGIEPYWPGPTHATVEEAEAAFAAALDDFFKETDMAKAPPFGKKPAPGGKKPMPAPPFGKKPK